MNLIILVVLILISAFFAAAETALTTVSRPRIAHLVELKRGGARTLRKLRENPARLLSTILVGNNLVNISASVFATTLVSDYFERIGRREEGIIIGVVIGTMTLFILVFGEITPKTIAIRDAEKMALRIAPLMALVEWILTPLVWAITRISRPFVFIFGATIPEQGPFITQEEINTLLFVGEKEGLIEREEREIISSVFKFGDLTVKEVMTPVEKIICLETEETVAQAIQKIKQSGHSRLPVIDQNINNILGVVFAKDLLNAIKSDKVSDFMRPVLFIPGIKKVNELMEQMQAEYKHLAIVIDEFGHTLGLVSLEDLLEEIVGEIHDEYERRK